MEASWAKRARPALWLAVVALLAVFSTPHAAQGRPGEEEADGLLIAFKPSAAPGARMRVVQELDLEPDAAWQSRHFARVRLGQRARARGFNARTMARRLRQDPNVRVAEPDYRLKISAVPNDVDFGRLYGLHNTGQTGGTPDADIDAVEAWDKTTGSAAVVVAVIDTGVDTAHPDLTQNILRNGSGAVIGYDYLQNDAIPQDLNGHGTHCAGTIGGKGNNSAGVAGVCHTVRIMPLRFLDANGSGSSSDAIECIDFATANGAHVMSNSWGGGGFSQLMLEAIQRARNAGILFVAAAGNDGTNNDSLASYPSGYNRFLDNVISVGASDDDDNLAAFSNYGVETVDIAAPGVQIWSTKPANSYQYMSGTSMATPHVAGAAALVRARFPAITAAGIKARLLSSVDHPAGLSGKVARGRLNVDNALVEDTNPPGTPTALTVNLRAADALRVAWTSSGDDGAVGTAHVYELRYGFAPITDLNFASAAVAIGLPAPLPSGSPQSFMLQGLTSSTSYYLALAALDKVGNISGIATIGPVSTRPGSADVVLLSDNGESAPLFSGITPWALTTELAASPTHSYTDSPGLSYLANTDSSLTQNAPVTLAGISPWLRFKLRRDLEEGYDFLFVEVSSDLGDTWQRLSQSYTGTVAVWVNQAVPLGQFYGQSIQVRFRLVADNIIQANGVWLDDIQISGPPLEVLGGDPVPAAPSDLNAQPISPTSVTLTWNDNSGDETGFRIRRRVGAGSWAVVGTPAANLTSFSDNTAAPNTTYNYQIVAYNGVGESFAAFDTVTTPPNPPGAPSNLAATPADKSVQLAWIGSSGAASYTLRRSLTSGGPFTVQQSGITLTSYVDTGLTNGTTYYYTVSAVNGGGESGQSASAGATPSEQPPAAVTGVTATRPTAKKAVVRWTQSASPSVTQNRIYRATASAGPWTEIATIPAAISYSDIGLNRKVAYYYQVTALSATGLESARSGTAFVKRK